MEVLVFGQIYLCSTIDFLQSWNILNVFFPLLWKFLGKKGLLAELLQIEQVLVILLKLLLIQF